MVTAAQLLGKASCAAEALWDPAQHPRAGAGSASGGQFSGGSSASTGTSGRHQRTHAPAKAPAGRSRTGTGNAGARLPKGVLAYNPKSNTGPGYNMPHGDKRVHQLQAALTRLGVTDAKGRKLVDDGKLGPLTTQAVKAAQARLGVQPTGQVTPAFLKQLLALKTLPPARSKASVTAAELLHGHSPAVAVLEAWDPAQHPRIPKGQPGAGKFLSLVDRVQAALTAHRAQPAHRRPGDPFQAFNRDQLMRVARQRGVKVPRGASRDDVATLLRYHFTPGSLSAPAPIPPSVPTPPANAPAHVANALSVAFGTHPSGRSHHATTRLQAYGQLTGAEFQGFNPSTQQRILAHLQQISTTSKGNNRLKADNLIWRFTPAGTTVGAIPPQPVLVPNTAKSAVVKAATPQGTPGLLKVAKDRGAPGDGWYRMPDGTGGPWGKYGAAGLMLSHVGTDGKRRYLMIQRGPAISDPGKWQFPGGAIDSKETAHEGAARETIEELGFRDDAFKDALVHGEHVHSVAGGAWKYTSIAATVPHQLTPDLSTHHARAETSDAQWMTAEEIDQLDKRGKLLAPLAGGKLKKNIMSLFPPTTPTGALPPPKPDTIHKQSKAKDLLSDKAAVDALRQQVKQDRVKYDGKTADGRLAAIGAIQGFDDVPTVVNKSEMDRLLATGQYIEAWRGVRGAGSSALAGPRRGGGSVSGSKTSAQINEDMRSGTAYYGRGIFGNGYYLAEAKSIAQNYSDGRKNSVIRVLIPKDALVVDHADAMREATMIASPLSKAKGNSFEDGTLFDEGRYAAAKGYAGIRIPPTSRNRQSSSATHIATRAKPAWNWLDRSVLIVQEADK